MLPTCNTDLTQLKVRGSEIVTPFRQTVDLVNAGKSNPRQSRYQTSRQNSTHQRFWRKQEDVDPTCSQASKDILSLFTRLVSVDTGPVQASREATYLHHNAHSKAIHLISFSEKPSQTKPDLP